MTIARWIIHVLGIAVMILAGPVACGKRTNNEEEFLRIAVADATKSQSFGKNSAHQILTHALHRTLIRLDLRNETVPDLASNWSVRDDGMSILFRIRRLNWENGKQVKADDVVRSFRSAVRNRKVALPDIFIDALKNARLVRNRRLHPQRLGVHALTTHVVEFRLNYPLPSFLRLLALPQLAITPTRRQARNKSGTGTAGLGPYIRKKMETVEDVEAGLLLTVRENYVGRHPKSPKDIILFDGLDPITAVSRFQDGELDLVMGYGLLGLQTALVLAATPNLQISRGEGSYGIAINFRQVKDGKIRKLLRLAIDQHQLSQALLGPWEITRSITLANKNLVPEGVEEYQRLKLQDNPISSSNSQEKLDFVKKRLNFLGYNQETPLVLTIAIPEGSEFRTITKALKKNLEGLPITLKARVITKGRSSRHAYRRDHLILVYNPGPRDAPEHYLEPLICKGFVAAITGHCDREVQKLYKDALKLSQIPDRNEILAQVEARLLQDNMFIPILVSPSWALVSEQLQPLQIDRNPVPSIDTLRYAK